MSDGVKSMNDFVAVKNDGNSNIIGKLIYFTVGRALIKEDKVEKILEECDMKGDVIRSKHVNTHAFKSATKLLEQKRKVTKSNGELKIYRIRILDNQKQDDGNILRREIKLEEIRDKKNKFTYLGNFTYNKELDKENQQKLAEGKPIDKYAVDYSLNPTTIKTLDFDLQAECDNIIRMYDYAKTCYNENRLVNLIEKYIKEYLSASPINIHGKLFFIPKFKNKELSKLEQFMMMIEDENEIEKFGIKGNINFASIPVMDDEKYIREYSKEFYAMASEELEFYQQKLDEFIKKGKTEGKVFNAYIEKIEKFLEKKRNYEETFKRNLDELDDDISLLDRQMRELNIIKEKKEKEEKKEDKGE